MGLALVILVAIAVVVLVLQRGEDQNLSIVILGGTLIDGTGKAPIESATIAIQGDKIVRIYTRPRANWPKGVQVIDARDKFIIPGLWDTHIHVGGSAGGKVIEKALRLDPKSANAHMALGRWYFFTPKIFGGNLNRALQAFEKALELAITDHERFLAHIWLGQALLKKQDKPKAKAHFEQALAIYHNSGWAKALLAEAK